MFCSGWMRLAVSVHAVLLAAAVGGCGSHTQDPRNARFKTKVGPGIIVPLEWKLTRTRKSSKVLDLSFREHPFIQFGDRRGGTCQQLSLGKTLVGPDGSTHKGKPIVEVKETAQYVVVYVYYVIPPLKALEKCPTNVNTVGQGNGRSLIHLRHAIGNRPVIQGAMLNYTK